MAANNPVLNSLYIWYFCPHTSLKLPSQVLDLAKNLINQIDNNGFSDLKSLTELNLHKNQLQSIQGDIIQGLTLLRNLFLDCNPMKIVTTGNICYLIMTYIKGDNSFYTTEICPPYMG
jgi:Leucine-rich repeat (LRR) protein